MTMLRRHANGKIRAADKVEAARKRIEAMRHEGVSWHDIAEIIGVGYTTLRITMDPDYEQTKYAQVRARIREAIPQIEALRTQGKTWAQIAKELGFGLTNLRAVMTPLDVEKDRDANKQRRLARQKSTGGANRYTSPVKVVVLGELPPPDTRDLTARICGDPLPGRSYLDRLKAQQKESA